MPFDRFPGTTLAEDRAEEARERKRDAERAEFDQIMKPLIEPLATLKAAAATLKERSKMIPYLSAETDCRLEATALIETIELTQQTIVRAIKDAVEDWS